MNRLNIPIDRITISDRLRADLGDIDGLATSLARYGLIQPVVVNQDNQLVAGGRRIAAAIQLGWTTIDVVYRETLSQDELHELELEENIRRKDMTWQERCLSIAHVHRLKQVNAHASGASWGMRETGELLGIASVSNVQYAIRLADRLKANDTEIAECVNPTEALRVLLARKEAEISAKLVHSLARPAGTPSIAAYLVETEDDAPQSPLEAPVVHLSRWIRHADGVALMEREAEEARSTGFDGCVQYIVTDPPYAIDMAMLDQDNTGMDVSSVEKEHTVEGNEALLERFMPAAYGYLRESGWLVMWCDPTRWTWLCDLATEAGFRVQRWPLVWCKSHACMNQAAYKNWTKSVEFALVASKGNATLLTPQPVCHFTCSNDEGKKLHPFAKPVKLWRWVYEAIAMKRMAIFDPFAGSGSSCVAAIEHGCTPLACEINEQHFNLLKDNVAQAYRKLAPNTVFK